MATTKAISSFPNNTNLETPPKPPSKVLDNIQQLLECFLQQADALANNPNCTTDLLGKLEQIHLPLLNQESQGSHPDNRLLLLESTTRVYALIHCVLTNPYFKNLKGGVSDSSYKAVKSSLKHILSGLSQISKKPPSTQEHTSLYDLNSDAFRVIASYLTKEELISLGRLFRPRAYHHLIPTIRDIFYKRNPPKIFPCNYGTLISSGAPAMRIFFNGQDPSGQMNSTGEPSSVFLKEIESLRYESIVSVCDTTNVEQVFPQDRVSGFLLILSENGKAYSTIFHRGSLDPLPIYDPIIEISCNLTFGHFLRTKKNIFIILENRGLPLLTSIPHPENIVQMTANSHFLAFLYKDGSVKIFDNRHFKELDVFLGEEQVTLQSIEKIFGASRGIFLSMNSQFYQITQLGERAQLTASRSLAGKKVVKVAVNGRFVFTEKEGVWAKGINSGGCLGIGNTNGQADYVQVRTLDHISEVFDLSDGFDYATLFLAGGKLYFAGKGPWRSLVGQNLQEEYPVPTPLYNTQHLTIKSAWSRGKNIWILAETGVYQLSTVDKPLDGVRRYGAPPTHYFRDVESIPLNIAMLTAWNKIYSQQIFKSEDWLSADDVIREAISSSSNWDELHAKLEKLIDKIPDCPGLNQFLHYLNEQKPH